MPNGFSPFFFFYNLRPFFAFFGSGVISEPDQTLSNPPFPSEAAKMCCYTEKDPVVSNLPFDP